MLHLVIKPTQIGHKFLPVVFIRKESLEISQKIETHNLIFIHCKDRNFIVH